MTLHNDLIAAGLPVSGTAIEGTTVLFTRELTAQEAQTYESIVNPAAYRQASARADANAIPNWANWTEAEAQSWGMTNIGQPLIDGRANLPASLTLATTRVVILQIITILDAMWAMQWAMARMIIALRNHTRIIQ